MYDINNKKSMRKSVYDKRMKKFDIHENARILLELYKKVGGEKDEK